MLNILQIIQAEATIKELKNSLSISLEHGDHDINIQNTKNAIASLEAIVLYADFAKLEKAVLV